MACVRSGVKDGAALSKIYRRPGHGSLGTAVAKHDVGSEPQNPTRSPPSSTLFRLQFRGVPVKTGLDTKRQMNQSLSVKKGYGRDPTYSLHCSPILGVTFQDP